MFESGYIVFLSNCMSSGKGGLNAHCTKVPFVSEYFYCTTRDNGIQDFISLDMHLLNYYPGVDIYNRCFQHISGFIGYYGFVNAPEVNTKGRPLKWRVPLPPEGGSTIG